ncbi:MAG: hypothetical protein M1281_05455 [Chloroflexi bacterium]|nr:hypothetical protein [Chloroflexota bacterium]
MDCADFSLSVDEFAYAASLIGGLDLSRALLQKLGVILQGERLERRLRSARHQMEAWGYVYRMDREDFQLESRLRQALQPLIEHLAVIYITSIPGEIPAHIFLGKNGTFTAHRIEPGEYHVFTHGPLGRALAWIEGRAEHTPGLSFQIGTTNGGGNQMRSGSLEMVRRELARLEE